MKKNRQFESAASAAEAVYDSDSVTAVELKNVGETIRLFRLTLGLSPVEFAEDIGLSPSYLRKVEMGRVDTDLETLSRCAAAFLLDVEEVLLVTEDIAAIVEDAA